MVLKPEAFPSTFARITSGWTIDATTLPAIASGMVGSTQGWEPTAYHACPADKPALAAALHPVRRLDGGVLYIVPGLTCGGSHPDMMRGEETEIIGALAEQTELRDSCLVLPGSHSKWVRVQAGRILDFTTFLTGELFNALSQHTILGRLADPACTNPRDTAFEDGARAMQASGALSPLLFSVRARVLAGVLPAESSLAYLSGMLIADEICQAKLQQERVTLIGDAALCRRYVRIFKLLTGQTPQYLGATAARGLWEIALQAGLVHS